MIKIDSHQHFWKLERGDYSWLTPNLKTIYRDFMPADIIPYLELFNIQGTVVVQAAPTLQETYFLLDQAELYPFIFGVVGWIDMLAQDACKTLEHLSEFPKFLGIRPMLQDITEIDWILKKKLSPCLDFLMHNKKTMDLLIKPKHLSNVIKLVERYPDLRMVLDHAAKPEIKDHHFEPWASQIKILSTHPNVYCKLSGLLTEAGQNTSFSELKPYLDHLFHCFGSKRIMWGSDFPVLNLVSDYKTWYQSTSEYVNRISPEAYKHVFGDACVEFYNLNLNKENFWELSSALLLENIEIRKEISS